MDRAMMGNHVQDALDQVRQLQHAILERIRFHGFSGPTRAISGTLALAAALFMATPYFPQTHKAHLLGWGTVLSVALLLNGGALIHWFLNDPGVRRNPRRLRPVLDVIPPLFVGGALTAAMIVHHQFNLLFGIWMLMFGLTNLASRHVLPRAINLVGLFYIIAGVSWVLTPHASFMNAWAMGIVFFAGEWAGGLILYLDDKRMERAAPEYYSHKETQHDAEDG